MLRGEILILSLLVSLFDKSQGFLDCSKCRNAFTPCCMEVNEGSSTDPSDGTKCAAQIPYSTIEVESEGDDIYIKCDPGSACLNYCEWKSPYSNQICTIDSSSNYGEMVCSGITFIGNTVTDGSSTLLSTCDIRVSNAEPKDAGMWSCTTYNQVVGKFVDNVNVTFATGLGGQDVTLKLGMILGISIPLGILLLILVLVICYCFCYRKSKEVVKQTNDMSVQVQNPPQVPQRRQATSMFEPPRGTIFDDIEEAPSHQQKTHQRISQIGRPIIAYPPASSSRKVSSTASIHSHRVPPIKKSSMV